MNLHDLNMHIKNRVLLFANVYHVYTLHFPLYTDTIIYHDYYVQCVVYHTQHRVDGRTVQLFRLLQIKKSGIISIGQLSRCKHCDYNLALQSKTIENSDLRVLDHQVDGCGHF